MNGKQARNLRQLIKANMPSLPFVAYQETNRRDKLFPVGINTDGSTRYTTVGVSTRVLDGCQRQAYQKAKKLHHTYNGR